MAPVNLACSECSSSETDSPSARNQWFSCDSCRGCICFKCVVGIASSDKKFVSRVVEGVRNSAVLSKRCKSCRERSSPQASSAVSAECVLEEKEASIRDEIGTLTTAVKESSEKLEEMKGEIRVVKGTVAEGATDSQALVSFFRRPPRGGELIYRWQSAHTLKAVCVSVCLCVCVSVTLPNDGSWEIR
ncbi:MAG: hypothetical protein GY820_37870 [Gammaproteobacteria bacterium]|nr:hypothetical protein [Gammaproteobacteria bacterium]